MGGRRFVLLGVFLVALLAPSTGVSSPNGVGDEANEGCLCHSPVDQTTVRLDGLPDVYERNTSYALSLSVENPSVPSDGVYAGGFRILVSNGTLAMNTSLGQELGTGWTHTESGAGQRSWDLVWTSPANNTLSAASTPSIPSAGWRGPSKATPPTATSRLDQPSSVGALLPLTALA